MEMKIYPVCARCSIVMNPNAFDDVAPGFLINGPECAKDWLKDEVDSDPEAVARAMGIAIIEIPED